jgi:hypothetical protein
MSTMYVGALLVAGALLIATEGTPLYDGIGFPDEPYRYVDPPAGHHQKNAPTDATATLTLLHGVNKGEGLVSSRESGPQVALYIPPGELHVTSSATRLTVRARPVPGGALPVDGTPNSNVYELDLGPAPVTFSGSPPNVPNISLREAVYQSVLAVMEYRATESSPWKRLPTQQVGRDVFLGFVQGPGQYVLVQPGAGSDQRSRDRGSNRQLVLILGACVLILGVLIASMRGISRRTQQS